MAPKLRHGKTKVAPSKYPKLPFHGLRCAQLVSSIIVGAIMLYFIWHLNHDHWKTPWTFIFFCAAALFTIVALTFTIVLHCCMGLNPRLNLTINTVLFALWAAGFGMLSWWASKTIFHTCDVANIIGSNEAGRMVCRIYKALYAFALLGFLSTLFALVLDIVVFKRAIRLGKYQNMQDADIKHADAAFQDDHDLAGYNGAQEMGTKENGYSVPQQQFGYDTSYGASRTGFRD